MDKHKNSCGENGVSMLEFALVAVILFVIIGVFLDIGRYVVIRAMLLKGAQIGLSLAEKIENLDTDTSTLSPADPAYLEYVAARNAVISASVQLPLSTLVSAAGSGATAELATYVVRDAVAGGSNDDAQREAMVLIPGTSAFLHLPSDPPGQGTWINHPAICFPDSDPAPNVGTNCPTPRSGEDSMESMLRRYPIVVELRAKMRTFTPGFGEFVIRGTAMGWREFFPKADFKQPVVGVTAPDTTSTDVPPPNQGGPGGGACSGPSCFGGGGLGS